LWLTAEGVSLTGDNIFYVALSWTVVDAHGAGSLAWVLTAGALPRGLLMLLGGAVVDRVGPLRLAVLSDISRALVLGAITAAVWVLGTPLALLVALAAVFGVADALYYPASGALPSLLVPASHVVRVQNVRNLLSRTGLVVGPIVGGLLVSRTGPELPFLADAATFLLCAVALAACRPAAGLGVAPAAKPTPPEKGDSTSLLDELRGGFSYITHRPALATPLLAAALFEFAINGVINVGYPAIAASSGWGSAGFGFLSAGMGVGAGVSALLLSIVPRLAVAHRVYIAAAAAAAAALITVAHAGNVATAAAASAILGVAAGAVAGVIFPLLQHGTDRNHIGRVMSMFYFLTAGLAPLSLAAIAAIINAADPPVGLTCAAAAAVGAGLVGYLGSRPTIGRHEAAAATERPSKTTSAHR